ncbi:hypothetical protein HDU89_000740 [Geranomyces variabilis]|nr:hypothetical protein HDU89_000740 [Geranomyces variabilis]
MSASTKARRQRHQKLFELRAVLKFVLAIWAKEGRTRFTNEAGMFSKSGMRSIPVPKGIRVMDAEGTQEASKNRKLLTYGDTPNLRIDRLGQANTLCIIALAAGSGIFFWDDTPDPEPFDTWVQGHRHQHDYMPVQNTNSIFGITVGFNTFFYLQMVVTLTLPTEHLDWPPAAPKKNLALAETAQASK